MTLEGLEYLSREEEEKVHMSIEQSLDSYAAETSKA